MEEKLRSALEEVESTKLIIELLKSDSEKYPPLYDREVNPHSDVIDLSDISGIVHSNESANNKWKTSKIKCWKKTSPLRTEEENNVSHLAVANRFEHLLNLQDTQEENVQPMIQGQYGVHLQFLREDDATSGTHDQDNISESHGDSQKHPQLHQNERTQKMGKNIKKPMDECQGHYIPTIINGKIEEKIQE